MNADPLFRCHLLFAGSADLNGGLRGNPCSGVESSATVDRDGDKVVRGPHIFFI